MLQSVRLSVTPSICLSVCPIYQVAGRCARTAQARTIGGGTVSPCVQLSSVGHIVSPRDASFSTPVLIIFIHCENGR